MSTCKTLYNYVFIKKSFHFYSNLSDLNCTKIYFNTYWEELRVCPIICVIFLEPRNAGYVN